MTDVDDFLGRWQEWHARREERLTAPDGFLTITALHWLDDRPRRFADLPGEWCQVADGVEVRLADGERLDVDGRRLTGRHVFTGLDADGVRAVHGDVVVEVAVRGGSAMLRPRRPDHELRLDHAPTPTYPPSRRWVLPARFLPYDESRPLPVDTVVEHVGESIEAVGEVELEIDGQVHRLVAFSEDDRGGLWLLFADGTSGETTYASRQVVTGPPAADGSVEIDFNRATNPPCAYTPYSTCPLPPPQNRLPVRIEAGEQLPAGS